MRSLIAVAVLVSTGAMAACPALDYQELKDMKDTDLREYACKIAKDKSNKERVIRVQKEIDDLKASFARIDRRYPPPTDPQTFENAKALEACQNEEARIRRLAESRGSTLSDLLQGCVIN